MILIVLNVIQTFIKMVVSVFVMMDFSLMVQAKLAMHVNLFVKPAKKH